MKACFIIAEAGVNHNGSEELALQLVETAAKAGADAVKFQTFKPETLVAKGTATAEYQKKLTGSNDQFSMLKSLELSEELHRKLFDHCVDNNVEFMSTAFDADSAKFLLKLGIKRLKVPSGELTNLPLIGDLAGFNKPMIISTGMASLEEVTEAVKTIRKVREAQEFTEPLEKIITILHCTSNYPARMEDVNLKAMQTIAAALDLPVGYSDHTDTMLVSVAAVAMGAVVIEKHFTMDKNLPGPDHKASLEPEDLDQMIKQIRQLETCLGNGEKLPCRNELPIRDLVRRSVALSADKVAGEVIQVKDLMLLRPGTGIPPGEIEQVIGKRLKIAKNAGTLLTWKDLM